MNRAGKISAVTRIGRLWDVILVADDGFGVRMRKKVCVVTQIRLGAWGGGGTIGGGGRRIGIVKALGSRAPTHAPPPPRTHGIPLLGPRTAPAPSGPAQPERTHANQKEGTMENDPRQCFFIGAENRIRAGTGAPFARRKEQYHILYGNEHVTMTLLLTSGSNHTIRP